MIEVWRQYPYLIHEYPGGSRSMRPAELALYIAHIKIRAQIKDREERARLRELMPTIGNPMRM